MKLLNIAIAINLCSVPKSEKDNKVLRTPWHYTDRLQINRTPSVSKGISTGRVEQKG